MGQVAGTVVTVAAFYRGGYGGFAFAFGRFRRDGQLAFQTAEGVESVAAGQPALGAAGFAVQPVAFDVGDGFAVKGDPVQVAAAVVEVLQAAAAGQFDRGTVAVAVVAVAHVAELVQQDEVVVGVLPVGFRQCFVPVGFGAVRPESFLNGAAEYVVVEAGDAVCVGGTHEAAFGIVAETGLPFAAVLPQQAAGQPSQAVAVKGGGT